MPSPTSVVLVKATSGVGTLDAAHFSLKVSLYLTAFATKDYFAKQRNRRGHRLKHILVTYCGEIVMEHTKRALWRR